MPTPALSADVRSSILAMVDAGHSHRDISAKLGVAVSSVSRVRNLRASTPPPTGDKKVGTFNWREAAELAKGMQELKRKMSWSQDEATIKLGDGSAPVILMSFGDQHIGSYGANYDGLVTVTDEIIETPGLYVALMGDYTEMAIKMRSVLEVTSQVLTPEMQEAFLETWLDDIKHKVAFATWDNHAVMRQESQAGTSSVKNILSRRSVYHNGIGHSDLVVGSQVYKCAASHKFRGGSMFNRMHAQGRYVRQQASDRELVLMGDIHQWGFAATEEGGNDAVYITGGTLQANSGYAKRFFSLKTAPHYPCVVLHHDRHAMVPFKAVKEALAYVRGYQVQAAA
jgi:hypothetical protein